jgi:hypothetical protein
MNFFTQFNLDYKINSINSAYLERKRSDATFCVIVNMCKTIIILVVSKIRYEDETQFLLSKLF